MIMILYSRYRGDVSTNDGENGECFARHLERILLRLDLTDDMLTVDGFLNQEFL